MKYKCQDLSLVCAFPSEVMETILVTCLHGHYVSVKYTNVRHFNYRLLMLLSLSTIISSSSSLVIEWPWDF